MAEEFNGSPLAWLRRVFDSRDDEIDCSECFELVSRYVDLEMETEEAAARMPQLIAHLDQCPACLDTYQVLRDVAQLNEQGGMPSVEELLARLKKDE